SVQITGAADLTSSMSGGGNLQRGQTGVGYSITVTNVGASPSSGTVSVSDSLSAGLTVVSMSGDGWSCSVSTLTCSRIDALAPGASYAPISLIVNVSSTVPATITNTVSVTGGG